MKLKTNLKRPAQPWIQKGLVGALLLQAVACNPTSDNLKKYTELRKTLGPVHNTKLPIQEYSPTNLYNIETEPKTPIFVVGRRNTIKIRTGVNLPGVTHRLVSNDLPRGAEPLRETGKGEWELAWTPPKDILPQNFNDHPNYSFRLSLDISPSNDPQIQNIIQTLATDTVVTYTLLRSDVAPEVIAVKGIKNYREVTEINEGDIVNLEIVVKDPSSSNTQKPKLIPVVTPNRINREQQILSGHAFLFVDNEPVQVAQDTWQFKASFDTANNSVPEFSVADQPTAPNSILANLTFQILSSNRTLSPEQTITFNVTYKRELLRPNIYLNPGLAVYSQDSQWSEKFKVALASRDGEMVVFLPDETSNLPGNPTLGPCKNIDNSSRKQECTVNWKIPCDLQAGDYQIKVNAAGEYGDQKTSKEVVKTIRIKESNSKKKCVSKTKISALTNGATQSTGSAASPVAPTQSLTPSPALTSNETAPKDRQAANENAPTAETPSHTQAVPVNPASQTNSGATQATQGSSNPFLQPAEPSDSANEAGAQQKNDMNNSKTDDKAKATKKTRKSSHHHSRTHSKGGH